MEGRRKLGRSPSPESDKRSPRSAAAALVPGSRQRCQPEKIDKQMEARDTCTPSAGVAWLAKRDGPSVPFCGDPPGELCASCLRSPKDGKQREGGDGPLVRRLGDPPEESGCGRLSFLPKRTMPFRWKSEKGLRAQPGTYSGMAEGGWVVFL